MEVRTYELESQNDVLKSLWSEQNGNASFLQKVKQESLVFMIFY